MLKNSSVIKEIRRLIKAFGYSLEGIKAAFGEAAFRVEILVSLVAVPAAFFITSDPVKQVLMIGSVFLVMIIELLNTAVETAINRISLEIHPLSKKAKDIASAAVLLSIVNAVIIWVIILFNISRV